VTAVLALFSGLIWTVPGGLAAQGKVMTGWEQFVGDLYVLAGLIGLGLIAGLLVVAQRRERHGTALAPERADEDPVAQPS
jgi:hypothetical protein